MNFGLLIVGDEILSGKRADKHLPKVIELLAARGLALPGRATSATTRRASPPTCRTRSPAATWSSRAAASARRPTTTRASAPPRRSACRSRCIREARDLIIERMRDIAREQGMPFEPDRDDNRHRLNMGVFPAGAEIIPNPYNKIAGFAVRSGEGGVFFVPGFPVMAWPMIEWVLDTHYRHLHVAPSTQRALGDRLRRDGGGADAADGGDRGASSRHQGVQPAERRPSRVGPPHRARRQGRRGAPRRRLRRAARRPARARRQARPRTGALSTRDGARSHVGAFDAHPNGARSPGATALACFLLNSVRVLGPLARGSTRFAHPTTPNTAPWEID